MKNVLGQEGNDSETSDDDEESVVGGAGGEPEADRAWVTNATCKEQYIYNSCDLQLLLDWKKVITFI